MLYFQRQIISIEVSYIEYDLSFSSWTVSEELVADFYELTEIYHGETSQNLLG